MQRNRESETPSPGNGLTRQVLTVRQLYFWLLGALFLLVMFYLLKSILLPFIVGLALAYVLDPVCDRLEDWGMSRLWATLSVCLLILVFFVAALLMLVPLILHQAAGLLNQIPEILHSLRDWFYRTLFFIEQSFNTEVVNRAQEAMSSATDNLVSWVGTVAGNLISGGMALFNILALLVISPIVTFFMLRDWDTMIAKVDSWLPRQHLLTLRGLAREVDETLAGFIRGQGLVCLFLGVFYAVGLTASGLNYGVVIGLIAGVLSFIPYAGSIIGFFIAVGVALGQFDEIWRVAIVAGVFMLGQGIEGNILTPKLVGDRVRLHPVWVMFGLLAGGALFGFAGVLLAVPVTAVIGVGVRFLLDRYKRSAYYHGGDEGREAPLVEQEDVQRELRSPPRTPPQ